MLSLVPTPIGNIGDISLRAIELLSEADILLCEDTRVTKKLIHILKERYNTTFKENQEFISLHSHNEQAFVEKLEPSFFEQNIVYVSDTGNNFVIDTNLIDSLQVVEKKDSLETGRVISFEPTGTTPILVTNNNFIGSRQKNPIVSQILIKNKAFVTYKCYESPVLL